MSWVYRTSFRLVLAAMVVMLGLLVQKSVESMQAYREVAGAAGQLSEQIEEIRQGNALLTAENERLLTDMAYYEQLGREVFGLVKPDEMVYIVNLP
jgi:cell division protein FtsB